MDWNTSERAVSDVLAFVLTIGIILTAATTAYVVGIDELTDVRDFEEEQSAVRAMEGAGGTFAEVYRGDAPRRSVELAVGEGTLTVEDASISVRVLDSGGTVLDDRTFQTNALSLSNDGVTASFESGLVAQRSGDVALDRRRPALVCGEAVATVTAVKLRGASSHGGGSVVVDATRDATASALVPMDPEDGASVVVDVSGTANRDAWERSLKANPDWSFAGSGQYECTAETVFVRHVVIDLYVRS